MTNAIILAAGYGSRLSPITDYCHKALIKVNGISLIEKQILVYRKINVEKIFIVTGYKSECFEYLAKKYNGIHLVYNDKYKIYNNFYSIHLVKEYLQDCYISEGDIYFSDALDITTNKRSVYFTKKNCSLKTEWHVISNEQERVTDIRVEKCFGKYISAGISFLNIEDGKKLQQNINKYNFIKNNKINCYWDDYLILSLADIHLHQKKLGQTSLYEIDDIEDLIKLNKALLGRRRFS